MFFFVQKKIFELNIYNLSNFETYVAVLLSIINLFLLFILFDRKSIDQTLSVFGFCFINYYYISMSHRLLALSINNYGLACKVGKNSVWIIRLLRPRVISFLYGSDRRVEGL